jgi:hypothetical protein
MNQLTIEWVDKAEGDFSTALREFRVRKSPNYDAVCFHAQQCVEKYLKARLQCENWQVQRSSQSNRSWKGDRANSHDYYSKPKSFAKSTYL